MISVEGLVVRFSEDGPPAVDGIDLDVARGETFGLVGESGCGKSSVLRAVAGLNRDYEGEIRVDGERMTARRSKASFRRMQMVFQDPYGSLHPRKTVRAQLLEPLHIQGLDRPNERVGAALDAVKLGRDFRHRFPHQLSGGQRQRVAIARALVLEPSVLLLDEPTSALDVSVQAEILNLLADLRDARGLTYLLVSHDLGVIAHLCGRVAIMQAGRIVERLDVAQLRSGEVAHPYSRELLAASEAYGE